jgi:hypothetical protein
MVPDLLLDFVCNIDSLRHLERLGIDNHFFLKDLPHGKVGLRRVMFVHLCLLSVEVSLDWLFADI